MRRIFLILAIVATTATVLLSCQKGDAGPAGPAGPAGSAGPAGPAGPTGTANVTYSNWFSFVSADWTGKVDSLLGDIALANKATTAVTQAVLDNGLVMGYVKLATTPNPSGVILLPATVPLTDNVLKIGVLPSVGNVGFYNQLIDGSDIFGLVAPFQFRYIIIPGGVAGRGVAPTYNGFTAEQLKAMSYEQVASLFNIAE